MHGLQVIHIPLEFESAHAQCSSSWNQRPVWQILCRDHRHPRDASAAFRCLWFKHEKIPLVMLWNIDLNPLLSYFIDGFFNACELFTKNPFILFCLNNPEQDSFVGSLGDPEQLALSPSWQTERSFCQRQIFCRLQTQQDFSVWSSRLQAVQLGPQRCSKSLLQLFSYWPSVLKGEWWILQDNCFTTAKLRFYMI